MPPRLLHKALMFKRIAQCGLILSVAVALLYVSRIHNRHRAFLRLRHGSEQERTVAAQEIDSRDQRCTAEEIAALRDMLADRSDSSREAATRALGTCLQKTPDQEAIIGRALAVGIKDSAVQIRQISTAILCGTQEDRGKALQHPKAVNAALPAIRDAARDGDADVRMRAEFILSRLSSSEKQSSQ